jgi:hypothetical protein
MIEELPDRLLIGTRVLVKELDTPGYVYERGVTDGGHTIYGIRLDTVAFPKNFVATIVWHCEREELRIL